MPKELDKIFKNSGIYKAKYIHIYSDFRIFFQNYKNKPKKFVNELLNLFVKRGITCIVPAFSYTTDGKFEVEKTKSKVGFLGNFILENKKFSRSEHPLFSFIAIGKNAHLVTKIGKSAFGYNSVHRRLLGKNCFFLNFCRPLKDGNTLVHHIEHINKANYRFDKIFKTKVYLGSKYYGTNYSAYLRKNLKSKKSIFSFNKVFRKLKKDYFFRSKIFGSEILIYEYDKFYADLNKFYKKDKKIFLKFK